MSAQAAESPWTVIARKAAAGDLAGACSDALRALDERPDDPATQRAAALAIVQTASFHAFPVAAAALDKVLLRDPGDADATAAAAYAHWLSKDLDKAFALAGRAIVLAPDVLSHYERYSLIALTSGRYVEAFVAAALQCNARPEDARARTSAELARRMAAGETVASVDFDGKRYLFQLTCADGQRLTSDICHVGGTLVEGRELRAMRAAVPTAEVIVEIGVLAGNHLMYFAKEMRPRRLVAVEASAPNLKLIARNVALNKAADPASFDGMEIVLMHAFVGDRDSDEAAAPEGAGFAGTARRRLDTLLRAESRVDLIKIDVDGAEIALLDGARETLSRLRPTVMIEVERRLETAFLERLPGLGYRVAATFDAAIYRNFLIVPEPR
ncbi:MAG: FkbM family methyltransferase [Alphaproteobacteria bacterium]|nr:FkbM family methyltransferase [Alphaproteobacteria bacterium]